MPSTNEYTGNNKTHCYNKLRNTYKSRCPPEDNNTWSKIQQGINCIERSSFDQARIEGKEYDWPTTTHISGWKYTN